MSEPIVRRIKVRCPLLDTAFIAAFLSPPRFS